MTTTARQMLRVERHAKQDPTPTPRAEHDACRGDDGSARLLRVVQPQPVSEDTAPSSCRRLRDGAQVHVDDRCVEVRDEQGRLLIRYADGHAVVEAPGGDLCLRAPQGSVRLQAQQDITLSAPGTLRQQAERVEVACTSLAAHAERSELSGESARLIVDRVTTVAAWLTQRAERYELEAERLVERTRDSLRQATSLWQVRAGTVRKLVEGSYRLRAERTSVISEKETSIDGSKVLLG